MDGLQERMAEIKRDAERWVRSMACPGKPLGHFKFSEHAYHPWCLYASNSALAIYNRLGLTDQLTEDQRHTWASVFLHYYDADLGLFLCPQLYGEQFQGNPDDPEDRVQADAAAPYKKLASKIYGLIGEMPPSADDGTRDCDRPEELEPLFDKRRDNQNPYSFGATVGDFFQKRTIYLRGQGKEVTGDPWIQWGYDYIEKILDPETGFVTARGDDQISGMNGLFKLSCSSFWEHDRPIPHGQKLIDSVLALHCGDGGFGDNCADFNATRLLCRLCRQEDGYRRDDITNVIGRSILDRLEQRRCPDGGFSFHPDHCLTDVNGYAVCDPLPEGDMFGTGQQITILSEFMSHLRLKS